VKKTPAPAPLSVATDSATAASTAALAVGTRVVLHGLSKMELNGRTGDVRSGLNEKGRQTIRLDGDSKEVALKPGNFKAVPPTASPAAGATTAMAAAGRCPDPAPASAAAVAPTSEPAKPAPTKPAAPTAPAPVSEPVAPARRKSAGKKPPLGQRQSASPPQPPTAKTRWRPSEPVPKVPMSMATAAELALFPVDQLVAHVLEHRRKEADQADAINRLKGYTETLLDKIMATHPEILQTTGTR